MFFLVLRPRPPAVLSLAPAALCLGPWLQHVPLCMCLGLPSVLGDMVDTQGSDWSHSGKASVAAVKLFGLNGVEVTSQLS